MQAHKSDRSCSIELLQLLSEPVHVPQGPLELHFVFGLFRDMDVTNCVKLAEDVIADFYGFNDRRIQGSSQRKVKVARGEEFIAFSLRAFDVKAFGAFQFEV